MHFKEPGWLSCFLERIGTDGSHKKVIPTQHWYRTFTDYSRPADQETVPSSDNSSTRGLFQIVTSVPPSFIRITSATAHHRFRSQVELAEPKLEPAHKLMSHLGKNLKHYQTKDTKTDSRHRKHFSVWVFIRIPNCKLRVTSVVQTIFRKMQKQNLLLYLVWIVVWNIVQTLS